MTQIKSRAIFNYQDTIFFTNGKELYKFRKYYKLLEEKYEFVKLDEGDFIIGSVNGFYILLDKSKSDDLIKDKISTVNIVQGIKTIISQPELLSKYLDRVADFCKDKKL